ncbi:ABC transporter permease [Candidatus Bathyarchaeota archaeon]|nr:ABC transporter permease [Candidatus Bathyarchaeota archaeon]
MKDDTTIRERVLNIFRKMKKLGYYWRLFPAVFWLVVFLVLPLSVMFIYSFWTMKDFELIPTWTLRHYLDIFVRAEGLYLRLLLKSLGMSAAVTLGSIALAYPAAYYISTRGGKYKYVLLNLSITPYMVSWVVLIFGWRMVIGYNGLVNTLLMRVGLISEPVRFWGNWMAVIFVLIVSWAPWLVLPIFVSLEKIDRTLLEAGADLGASPLENFRKITLPLSMPGLLVATFFVLIPTFGEYVAPVLAGGTSGAMIGTAIETAFKRMHDWPFGSAMSFLLLIIALITSLVLIRKTGLRTLMESL